jgi:hypothetical protein
MQMGEIEVSASADALLSPWNIGKKQRHIWRLQLKNIDGGVWQKQRLLGDRRDLVGEPWHEILGRIGLVITQTGSRILSGYG